MPDDDITHPIPDLTGYITEGQIVLSRALQQKRIFPPIDVLPCLSRLMNLGIGEGRTREDHRALADQLYAFYARGQDVRRLVAIVGEGGLSEEERQYLHFADRFETEFIHQGEAGPVDRGDHGPRLAPALGLPGLGPDADQEGVHRALPEGGGRWSGCHPPGWDCSALGRGDGPPSRGSGC